MMTDLFGFDDDDADPNKAQEARDRALKRVLKNAGKAWMSKYLAGVMALPRDWRGTGEELRLKLIRDGVPFPHHHNTWGGAAMSAIRQGLLVSHDEFDHMRTKKSHKRKTQVLTRA
jgi:hypothetical protein